MVDIRQPTLADIDALVANLRPLDKQELEATHPDNLYDAVRHAVHISKHRWAAEINGELALIGGVCEVSLLCGVGSPWLLGTRVLDAHRKSLTKIAVQYRDIARTLFPYLINYVDARNDKSIRWLKRIGFTVAEHPIPYGIKKMPFYKFELGA